MKEISSVASVVLIADDDRDLVCALAARCRRLNVEVLEAHDALGALTMISRYRPDVAILDVNMPAGAAIGADGGQAGRGADGTVSETGCREDAPYVGGNGMSIREIMAGEPEWSDIPVIILTGRSDEQTIRRCHDSCAYYVLKGGDIWERVEPVLCELLGLEAAC